MLDNNKNYSVYLFYIFFAFSLFFQTSLVKADDYFNTKVTPKEKAIFAFFRVTGIAPDFEPWIQESDGYKYLLEKKRDGYLLKETMRLGRGYGLYNKDKDLLELSVNVMVKYISATEEESPRIVFSFLNRSESYTPVFNYPYGKHTISLIINRLAVFANLELTQEQSDALLNKIPYKDDTFDAKLTIYVRASSADINNPIVTDDKKQWMMIGDVAYLRCDLNSRYGSFESKLWDYVAPWYEEAFRIKNMPEEEKYPHPFDLYKD